ncbi:MAG: hypothetical protein ABI838_00480 [Chloroflexota bacterium]
MAAIKVYLEVTDKKTFAVALDWPGWCRSARREEAALDALADYAPRYARVAKRSGVRFPVKPELEVVKTVRGDATTEFGAPSRLGPGDEDQPTATRRKNYLKILEACWAELDGMVARSPAALRKGPRGGGRDRDKMLTHVLESEAGYARYFDLKTRTPSLDKKAITSHRDALLEALRAAGSATRSEEGNKRWPFAYAVRRVAWHALDHAWEMEDRRDPSVAVGLSR